MKNVDLPTPFFYINIYTNTLLGKKFILFNILKVFKIIAYFLKNYINLKIIQLYFYFLKIKNNLILFAKLNGMQLF